MDASPLVVPVQSVGNAGLARYSEPHHGRLYSGHNGPLARRWRLLLCVGRVRADAKRALAAVKIGVADHGRGHRATSSPEMTGRQGGDRARRSIPPPQSYRRSLERTVNLAGRPSSRERAVLRCSVDGPMGGIPVGTSSTPVSEWSRHGEQVNQEPKNREGLDARLAADLWLAYNRSVYTLRCQGGSGNAPSLPGQTIARVPPQSARGGRVLRVGCTDRLTAQEPSLARLRRQLCAHFARSREAASS
jgi:hypothetical protein